MSTAQTIETFKNGQTIERVIVYEEENGELWVQKWVRQEGLRRLVQMATNFGETLRLATEKERESFTEFNLKVDIRERSREFINAADDLREMEDVYSVMSELERERAFLYLLRWARCVAEGGVRTDG